MKRNNTLVLFTVLALFMYGCGSADCDENYFIETTGIELLEEADFKDCYEQLDLMQQAVFKLNDKQVRAFLDGYAFQPVRSSLNQFRSPIRRLNKIVEEIDQLSTFEFKTRDDIRCVLLLKEDTNEIMVILITGSLPEF